MRVETIREVRIKVKRVWWKPSQTQVRIEQRHPGEEWELIGCIGLGGELTIFHQTYIDFSKGWYTNFHVKRG